MAYSDYYCSICGRVIPNRQHCSLGAIGFDKLFDGFAGLGLHHYACRNCIAPIEPACLNKRCIDSVDNCHICSKAKSKIPTRLRFHSIETASHIFPDGEIAGCYECIGRHTIAKLNQHFDSPTARIGCPTCRRAKGKHTICVLKIVSMGSRAYGDLILTCHDCMHNRFGWTQHGKNVVLTKDNVGLNRYKNA